jgi:glycosidase
MKNSIALVLLLVATRLPAQLLSWTPDFPKDNSNITITMDATKGNKGLLGFANNVYVHIGVITNLSANPGDWKYSKFAWGSTDPAALATPAGTNKWSYNIPNIRTFFAVPAGETILKIAILFRAGNCTDCQAQRNADGSDMYVPVYDNNNAVRFNVPLMQPLYNAIPEPINKMVGDNLPVTVVAALPSDMQLSLNGNVILAGTSTTMMTANPVLAVAGSYEMIVSATGGAADTINFFVAPAPVVEALPAGVREGINYNPNNTEVTLVLFAPQKSRVAILGTLPGATWNEQLVYQMKKTPDGKYFWLTIQGLTPGTEYLYQYLVDGQVKIGDAYSEKILDPWNDGFISATTYPNLITYPSTGASGIVSVLQTNQPSYNWTVNNFTRPDKRGLIIYELLLRDFINAHDWKTMMDTLNYLKNLGVNAIEIMPFNEFEGNISWGYNPDFFFAPDKYYGNKNSLKTFIDSCHRKGIAVIMDMVLNHATGLCPLAALYWNAALNRPALDNPWFNETAKHPFNVFNDFNHESLETRYFFSRVVDHWLTEYKLDGFRFDLSKGFTQVNSGGDVGLWGQYDASRVAIWKRYYDTLQLKSPGSYVILEHFADNSEEQELSNYGMMFWGNHNYQFGQAAKGLSTGWNFEGAYYKVRNWTQPNLIAYMESHDEERLMYMNKIDGNSSTNYDTKELGVALKRMEQAATFFFMIPGPKMIWQFGEMGYDFSINHCENGQVNPNCRLDPKPIRWNYLQDISRKRTVDVYTALLKLRFHPSYRAGFLTDKMTHDLTGAFKWLKITTDTSNICLIGNFGVTPVTGQVTFQTGGTWYDYLKGNTFTATGGPQNIELQPGEYRLYLNRNVTNTITTPVTNIPGAGKTFSVMVYPNPVLKDAVIEIENKETGPATLELFNLNGQKVMQKSLGVLSKGIHQINFKENEHAVLPAGTYFMRVQIKNNTETGKIVLF